MVTFLKIQDGRKDGRNDGRHKWKFLLHQLTDIVSIYIVFICYLHKRDITATDNVEFDCKKYVFQ